MAAILSLVSKAPNTLQNFMHCFHYIVICCGLKWQIWPQEHSYNIAIEATINEMSNYIMAGHAIVVVKHITSLFSHGNDVILTLW